MSRPTNNRPKQTQRIPVTEATYNLVTLIKEHLHGDATYETTIKELVYCYATKHKIELPGGQE